MKTPENTEEDPDKQPAEEILLSLIVQAKYSSSNKILPVKT